MLLTSTVKVDDVPSDIPECPDLEVALIDEDLLPLIERFDTTFQPATSARDMALFQYTSGTTRELPEAVRHRHQAVVTVAIAALYATGVRPGDRFCCPSSPAWGHGLAHGTLAPLALGVCISAWSGRFDGARFLEVLERHRITNLSAAATHYRMMKNCGTARDHGYELDKVSFTGEPIDSDTAEYIEDVMGLAVRSMYGTTEVGVILGCYPGAPDLAMKPGCLGKPMPGVKVEVHRTDGTRAAADEIGELVVERGSAWFPTKDLGRVDSDGYFYHAGRADDVIISAGWTMSAVEIEDTLLKHESVDEIAVIGVADELRGQVVKAFVVTRAEVDDELVELLQNWARERLGSHEYPRQIEFVAELPKTPAGKVNRKVLRDRERTSSSA
jgi:acetyl-CoA synthetase